MEVLFFALMLGTIPAIIAHKKGRPFLPWFIYGTFLFIVAVVHALLLKPDRHAEEARLTTEGCRKCPVCAEMIKAEALKCRYCQTEVLPAV